MADESAVAACMQVLATSRIHENYYTIASGRDLCVVIFRGGIGHGGRVGGRRVHAGA